MFTIHDNAPKGKVSENETTYDDFIYNEETKNFECNLARTAKLVVTRSEMEKYITHLTSEINYNTVHNFPELVIKKTEDKEWAEAALTLLE